jgi:hypothetical protein
MGRIRCGEKKSKSALLFCPSVCFEECGKIAEVPSHYTWLIGNFMKLRLSGYEESVLTVWPQRSFNETRKSLKFSRRFMHVLGSDALSIWREFRKTACSESKMATPGRFHVYRHISRS